MNFLSGFWVFSLLLIACMVADSSAEVSESWHSVNGDILNGKGVSWTFDGINIVRERDDKHFLIPFSKLRTSDVLKGIETLPFKVNDEVRLRAKTVSNTSQKLERNTGKYAAHVSLFSYDGYHYSGSGVISPIKEKYKVSGRTVEVHLSSPHGDGLVGVEFFGVKRKGKDRKIFHSEGAFLDFRGIGSVYHFSFDPVENLQGWVVVLRSPNTGEIVSSQGSMGYLKDFVVSELPKVAKVSMNIAEVKKAISNEAKLRKGQKPDDSPIQGLSTIFGKTFSWTSNGRNDGHHLIIREEGRGTIRGTPLKWEKIDERSIRATFVDGVKADLEWERDYKSFTGIETRGGGLKIAGELVE